MEYEDFRIKIVDLQSEWGLFKVDFLDRDSFKNFADNLFGNLHDWTEVCITGYFSETIREALEEVAKMQDHKVRLICQELDPKRPRDKKNLDVLKKLCKAGVQIKINNRIHARFLVTHLLGYPKTRGLLIIGSFDFNTECIGKERYDAGVKTTHPDLIKSAIQLFEKIWDDTESLPLNEKYP
jgi:hypothetical protein